MKWTASSVSAPWGPRPGEQGWPAYCLGSGWQGARVMPLFPLEDHGHSLCPEGGICLLQGGPQTGPSPGWTHPVSF